MSKASEIRRRQGFYRLRDGSHRTKPTVRNLGPRDPGPHGKTEPRFSFQRELARALATLGKGKA